MTHYDLWRRLSQQVERVRDVAARSCVYGTLHDDVRPDFAARMARRSLQAEACQELLKECLS